jgi:hypothetical protein
MSHDPPALKQKPKPAPEQAAEAAGALPDSRTASALMRAYAEPLLYADPAGPADIDTMRTSLMLAMICWNLPVYEAAAHPLYEKGVQTLDKVMQSVPRSVASTLRRLLDDRKRDYAARPYLLSVDVTGTTPENASIVAQARLVRGGRAATHSA